MGSTVAHCKVCGGQVSLGVQDPEVCERCFWMLEAKGLAAQLAEAQSIALRLAEAIEKERAILGPRVECVWVSYPDGSARAGCRPKDALWGFHRGIKFCAACGNHVVFVEAEEGVDFCSR